MVLEVATVAGSLLGGLTAQMFAESTLQRLFGAAATVVGLAVLSRLGRSQRPARPECRSVRKMAYGKKTHQSRMWCR
jgi:uncharacterized membrane protein YfcA